MSRYSVTIIEQHEKCSEVYLNALQRQGWCAKRLATGFHGLMDLVDDPPDAIVLSLELPDVDGRTVLSRIQEHPVLHSRPLVVVTGHTTPEARRQLRKAGAEHVLNRLADPPPRLVHLLEELLRGTTPSGPCL